MNTHIIILVFTHMSRKVKHEYAYEYVYKYNDTAKYAFVHGYANTCNHDDMYISYFVFFKKNLPI